ncbi:MAG: formylglycine-generating enzyme family protein [Xanthomonadales bacterium]|nr:formylglycine-generating enzyme family protein [Xanthomonadales bacterium]
MQRMTAATGRRAILLAGLVLAACVRAPSQPDADSAEALRRGIVTVGGDERSHYNLNWIPPVAELDGAGIAGALREAGRQLQRGHLYQDANSTLPLLFAVLRSDPANADALELRLRAIRQLIVRGEAAIHDNAGGWPGAAAEAHQIAAVLRVADANDPGVQRYLGRLDASDGLDALLLLGERDLGEGRLGEIAVGARTDFGEVLRNRPGDVRAISGLQRTRDAMIAQAQVAADAHDYANVVAWMRHAQATDGDRQVIAAAWRRFESQRLRQVQSMYVDARIRLQDPSQRGAIDAAGALLLEMPRVAVTDDGSVADLARRIDLATHYGQFLPGQEFSEALRVGGAAPLMRVVPAGSFMMGADPHEPSPSKAESPAHRVVFMRGFALGATEVRVDDYARFVAATGYRTRAERRGNSIVYDERSGNFARRSGVSWRDDYAGQPSHGDLPVLHLDVRDAEAYVDWLRTQTGRAYHLPTEAEFEYALRAGGQGKFPWGDGVPPMGAGNLTGALDVSPSGHRWANAFRGYGDGHWGPAPVASDAANAFGLHDLAGNVSEWVADCWHQGYRRAPADGAAWFNPGCRSRVVRGGSWAGAPDQVRSSWRVAQAGDITNARTGFRVARDL